MSQMARELVIRYVVKSDSKNQQILRIVADKDSTFDEPTCGMTWIRDFPDLLRLDIGGNSLVNIDLEPMHEMKYIRYLDFSENKLQEIDLTPLQTFEDLESIDLSYNCLKSIDLSPLANCERLRYVYLHVNQLQTVNLAPIAHLEHLQFVMIGKSSDPLPLPVYSSTFHNTPPAFLDAVQAMFCDRKLPHWLVCQKAIEEIECAPQPYHDLVTTYGWQVVREHLLVLQKRIRSKNDFTAQKIFLAALGFPELACYDGSVKDIFALVPTEGSYEAGVDHIRNCLISLLYEQLETGGSTLFFDIELLAATQASVLIPLIVSRRENELKDVTLYDYNGVVNLIPLWLTGFGFNILHALGCKTREDRFSIPLRITEPFDKLGIEISLKKTTSKKRHESMGTTLSPPLLEYVLSQVQ